MPIGKGISVNGTFGSKAHSVRSQNVMLGGNAKLTKMNNYVNQQKFTNQLLKTSIIAQKGILNEMKKNNNANNISNTVGAYYGSSNSANQYGYGTPSAQSANSAKNFSANNISGTLYEELANKNNELNIQMNRENNKFNAEQAEIQRNWESQMSNTAHQREVADLQASGLNPILSANAGASTPSGSSATASNWTGAESAYIHALAQLAASSMNSNATITAASLNSAAVQQAAAMNSAAQMYGSDKSLEASKYTSDNAYKSSIYGSDKGYKASLINTGVNGTVGLINALTPWM